MKKLQWLWYIKDSLEKTNLVFIIRIFYRHFARYDSNMDLFKTSLFFKKNFYPCLNTQTQWAPWMYKGSVFLWIGFLFDLGLSSSYNMFLLRIESLFGKFDIYVKKKLFVSSLGHFRASNWSSTHTLVYSSFMLSLPCECSHSSISNFDLALQVIVVEPTPWQVVFLYMTTWIQFNNSIDLLKLW
jgi:hypothetical protein